MGEVIGGSIMDLLVQVRVDPEAGWPVSFGSFVKVRGRGHQVVGVVVDARYESLEGARPRSRWVEERRTFDKIYPDLHEKFLSLAEVFVLGYEENGAFHQGLPPAPPEMHAPATPMSDEEVRIFHAVDPDAQRLRIDYVYRLIGELRLGRCVDLLRAVVERLEAFGLSREAVVREVSGAYMALGEEETALRVSSLLLQRG